MPRISRYLTLCVGIAGVLGAALTGCGSGGNNPPPTGGGGTSPYGAPGTTPFVSSTLASRSVCQANAHVGGRARWTVLVYINAANDLLPFSLVNVAQMASVGSDSNLNIILQWKQTAHSFFFTGNPVSTTPSFVGTRRYRLTQHSASDVAKIAPAGVETNAAVGDTTVLDGDRLANPSTDTLSDNGNPTADMGNYQTLQEFVQWGATNYPADHLAVVVWDHGSAALNVDNRAAITTAKGTRSVIKKNATRAVSLDGQTGSQIATWQLPLALANAPQPINNLIIDCSLQGTAEVAYDVRNVAKVMVGSEESPPGEGYPYDTWLAFLKSTTASPCDSGQNLINDTIARYPTGTNITQSMIDLSRMDALATTINAFGSSLLTNVSSFQTQIYTARINSQFFEYVEYKDLYDFADLIRQTSGVPADLSTAASNVQAALWGTTGAVLVSQRGAQGSETLASGLSIYLPGPNTASSVDNTVGFDPQWNSLGISRATPNWASFLQAQRQ